MLQHGVAARGKMKMIAALYRQRDRIAQPIEYEIGPRPHRDHRLAADHSALLDRNAPASVAVLLQRSGIADDEASPLAPEQRRVSLGEAAGIGHESRLRKMD